MHSAKLKLSLLLICIINIYCLDSPTDTNLEDELRNKILFIYNDDEFASRICIIDPNGSGYKCIAESQPDGRFPTHYEWARISPDGNSLVIQGGKRESTDYDPIYLMNMEGTILDRLTSNGESPLWTSDGGNIIFLRRRGYLSLIYDVYKLNIKTKEESLILRSPDNPSGLNSYYNYRLQDIYPGIDDILLLNETLVWEDEQGVEHDDDSELIFYDINSQSKTYLTNNSLWEGQAKIAKSQNLIAYGISYSDRSHIKYQIHLMTTEGDSLLRLSQNSDDCDHLNYAWSPSAEYLAYTKADQSEHKYNELNDIYIYNTTSKMENRVTNTTSTASIFYVMEWR